MTPEGLYLFFSREHETPPTIFGRRLERAAGGFTQAPGGRARSKLECECDEHRISFLV